MLFGETELPLMSSAAGSHAKILAAQENAQGLAMEREAGFMQKSSDLLATLDHDSSSWRMSQGCLVALLNN